MKYSLLNTREKVLLTLINRKTSIAIDPPNGCSYDQDINGGCAIGCLIAKHKSKKLQDLGGSVCMIIDSLPKRLTDLGEGFLQDMQNIHDFDENWAHPGTGEVEDGYVWSRKGKNEINIIIERYKIHLKPLDIN